MHLTQEIARLDADSRQFSKAEWACCYELENKVLAIIRVEEEYWLKRGGVTWITKGDTNTAYFHAYANGRKRKCAIPRLVSEEGLLMLQEDIIAHLYDFYIGLMGASEPKLLGMQPNLW